MSETRQAPLLSIVVPVRDRPECVLRLLQSFERCAERASEWELIVVEDGSREPCARAIASFEKKIPLRYIVQAPRGRSVARNVGGEAARGSYLLFMDSDCEAPENFVVRLLNFLEQRSPDFWGGPERARIGAPPVERAIAFSMNSLLSTGGLRRAGLPISRYLPRGMNMGIRRALFADMGGFRTLNGEDLELGLRVIQAGVPALYAPELFVHHKGRSGFAAFLKKAIEAGASKASIYRVSRGSLQPLYFLPSLTLVVTPFLLASPLGASVTVAYFCLVAMSALLQTRSVLVAALAPVAASVQIAGYGVGFVAGFFGRRAP